MTTLADLRRDYASRALDERDAHADPIQQFTIWFDEALKSQLLDVNAMTLATSSAKGEPSARTVLLKGADESGFVFYTNYDSAKGRDLAENPRASLLFFWRELERQVRITGSVTKTTEAVDPSVTVYSRMFAPSAGVVEDPATGSAAGPLGSYLVKHGLVHRNEMQDMVNLQGVAMGRPSRLHMRIAEKDGAITRVQVGGKSVLVGDGTIRLTT